MIFNRTHFHRRCPIIRNGLLAIAVNKQEISSIWTQRALNRRLNRNTGVDVGNDLALSLRRIRSYSSLIGTKSVAEVVKREMGYRSLYGPSFNTIMVGAWPAKAIFGCF